MARGSTRWWRAKRSVTWGDVGKGRRDGVGGEAAHDGASETQEQAGARVRAVVDHG